MTAVSTHSRLKAAGVERGQLEEIQLGFNTQPPEGGWAVGSAIVSAFGKFQHTAA